MIRWLVVLLGLLMAPSSAWAGALDFRLNGTQNGLGILYDCPGGEPTCRYTPNNAAFRDFTTQLGFLLAPRMASPAETLGHAGFHIGAMWSGTKVSNDQSYWQLTERGQQGNGAQGFMQTLQLDVRKGLPLSFEVGVNLMWLIDSQLFAPGIEVTWALQEGYKYIPDLAIRGAANHMVGNRDLNLTTLGLDVMLSKGFALGGVLHFTPYAGWSVMMIAATSRVIDPTPLDEQDVFNNLVFEQRTLASQLNHKVTVGLRTLVYVVNISVQGEFQVLSDYEVGGSGVTTITTKLGLDF